MKKTIGGSAEGRMGGSAEGRAFSSLFEENISLFEENVGLF